MLSICLIGWTLSQSATRGARAGLWSGWMIALLLLPSWFLVRIGAVGIDLRSVAAGVGLACVALFAKRDHLRGFLASDWLVAAIVTLQIASEYQVGNFVPLTVVETARVWSLPYLVGRCFFGSVRDARRSIRAFALPMAALALYATAEAATASNPFHDLLGKMTAFASDETGYRWGLKRAQVFLEHPIYLGFMLVLFLPWSLHARRLAIQGTCPHWWRFLPWLTMAAVMASGSRGPLIAGLATIVGPFIVARRRLRIPAMIATVACVGAFVAFQESTVDALTMLAGGTDEAVLITIDGREVEYTGTSHRILQVEIYDSALVTVGPFGYGSKLSALDFDDIPERFRSIDCHYLLFYLQYGLGGILLFLLLAGSTLVNLLHVVRARGSPLAEFATSLACAMASVTVLLVSVWFSPDFGTVWLFTAGLAATMRSLTKLPLTIDLHHEVQQ